MSENTLNSSFIEGWLTDEFAAGRFPVYGYQSASLPAVEGEIEIITGYMDSDAKSDSPSTE